MRHRRKGRTLGRNPSHQRAMLKNLASSLFLTERDAEFEDNAPKVKGRVVTTVAKAKEVRPLVEKCITIARRSLSAQSEADGLNTDAERNTDAWKQWREGDGWKQWNAAIAPVVTARRRVLRLLGDKEAMRIVFDEIAPRFSDRDGGYTRILKLATPRLGDAGPRAIIEFVGVHDRVIERSEKPAFDEPEDDETAEEEVSNEEAASEETSEESAAEETAADESSPEASSEEASEEEGETKET